MPKKQTRPRVSTIAGRMMRNLKFFPDHTWVMVKQKDLEAVLGSVLSQDEKKGQKR